MQELALVVAAVHGGADNHRIVVGRVARMRRIHVAQVHSSAGLEAVCDPSRDLRAVTVGAGVDDEDVEHRLPPSLRGCDSLILRHRARDHIRTTPRVSSGNAAVAAVWRGATV